MRYVDVRIREACLASRQLAIVESAVTLTAQGLFGFWYQLKYGVRFRVSTYLWRPVSGINLSTENTGGVSSVSACDRSPSLVPTEQTAKFRREFRHPHDPRHRIGQQLGGEGVGCLWIGRRLAVERASVVCGYGVGWNWIGRCRGPLQQHASVLRADSSISSNPPSPSRTKVGIIFPSRVDSDLFIGKESHSNLPILATLCTLNP